MKRDAVQTIGRRPKHNTTTNKTKEHTQKENKVKIATRKV